MWFLFGRRVASDEISRREQHGDAHTATLSPPDARGQANLSWYRQRGDRGRRGKAPRALYSAASEVNWGSLFIAHQTR